MTAFVLDCSVTMAWCFEDESDAYSEQVAAISRTSGLTAHDSAYLALAMKTGASLATRDRALRSACRKAGVALFRP